MGIKNFNLLLLVILFNFVFSSCRKDKKDDDSKPSVDQVAFLSNTSGIVYSSYNEFNIEANKLSMDVDTFIANPNQSNLNSAQASLKSAYLAWQNVNIFEFGPAEIVSLKSNLNIHPTDSVKIENNISNGNYDLSVLSNKTAKGFPALDYLLNSKTDSATISAFSNNASRRNYLHAVTDEIKSKTNTVFAEWSTYKNTFASNTGVDVGSSTGMLNNALNLHYEKFFRDNKIGIPLGVRSSGIPRPEMAEAYFGKYSLELAVENFHSMYNLYMGIDNNGNNGYGLDDYLVASNASELNNAIQQQMSVIDTKLKALNDPLPEQIANNPNQVSEVYNEVQKLIVLWKVDMPSRMGVLITYQDNDGD